MLCPVCLKPLAQDEEFCCDECEKVFRKIYEANRKAVSKAIIPKDQDDEIQYLAHELRTLSIVFRYKHHDHMTANAIVRFTNTVPYYDTSRIKAWIDNAYEYHGRLEKSLRIKDSKAAA